MRCGLALPPTLLFVMAQHTARVGTALEPGHTPNAFDGSAIAALLRQCAAH